MNKSVRTHYQCFIFVMAGKYSNFDTNKRQHIMSMHTTFFFSILLLCELLQLLTTNYVTSASQSHSAVFVIQIYASDTEGCLGALVLPLWVLSLATCITQYQSKNFTAVTRDSTGKGQARNVKYIKIHDAYYKFPRRFDIALLQLELSFKVDSNDVISMTAYRENLASCGVYAYDLQGNPTVFEVLILEKMSCRERNKLTSTKVSKRLLIDTTIVCAVGGSQPLCIYQMGSLLICDQKLLGLCWDIPKCEAKADGLMFTSISYFHTWVEEYIKRVDPTAFNGAHRFDGSLVNVILIYCCAVLSQLQKHYKAAH